MANFLRTYQIEEIPLSVQIPALICSLVQLVEKLLYKSSLEIDLAYVIIIIMFQTGNEFKREKTDFAHRLSASLVLIACHMLVLTSMIFSI